MRGQTEVKPIETEYNGYRFRSRLEARWAVFFDTAGIPYEYEPEGFVLTDGTYYLPDFYLPWYRCYVEIKPNVKEEIDRGFDLVSKLAYEKEKCIGMLCVGLPNNSDTSHMMAFFFSHNKYGELYESSGFVCFREGCWWDDENGEHGTTKHFISMIDSLDQIGVDHVDKNGNNVPVFSGKNLTSYRSDFESAVKAAKQARFEHGECGVKKKPGIPKPYDPISQLYSIFGNETTEKQMEMLKFMASLQKQAKQTNRAFAQVAALDYLLENGYEPEGQLSHEAEIRQFMKTGMPC